MEQLDTTSECLLVDVGANDCTASAFVMLFEIEDSKEVHLPPIANGVNSRPKRRAARRRVRLQRKDEHPGPDHRQGHSAGCVRSGSRGKQRLSSRTQGSCGGQSKSRATNPRKSTCSRWWIETNISYRSLTCVGRYTRSSSWSPRDWPLQQTRTLRD